jgi:hypothetical protein
VPLGLSTEQRRKNPRLAVAPSRGRKDGYLEASDEDAMRVNAYILPVFGEADSDSVQQVG